MALSKNPKMSFFRSNFLQLTSARTQMNYRYRNFAVICQPVGGRGAAHGAVTTALLLGLSCWFLLTSARLPRPPSPSRSQTPLDQVNGVTMEQRREGGRADVPSFIRASLSDKSPQKGSSFSVSQNDPCGVDGTRATFSRERGVFVLPSVVNGEQRNADCDSHAALQLFQNDFGDKKKQPYRPFQSCCWTRGSLPHSTPGTSSSSSVR